MGIEQDPWFVGMCRGVLEKTLATQACYGRAILARNKLNEGDIDKDFRYIVRMEEAVQSAKEHYDIAREEHGAWMLRCHENGWELPDWFKDWNK